MKYRILSFALAATFILFAFSACSQGDTEYINSGIVEIEGLENFSIIENPVYPDYSDAEIDPSACSLYFSDLKGLEQYFLNGITLNDHYYNVLVARVKRKNTTAYQRDLKELQSIASDDAQAQRWLRSTAFVLTEVEILEVFNQTFNDQDYEVAVGDTLIIKESNTFAKSEEDLQEKKAVHLPTKLPVQPGEYVMYLILPITPLQVGSKATGITTFSDVWMFDYFPLDVNKQGSVWLDNLHQDVLDKYVNKTYVAPVSSAPDEK